MRTLTCILALAVLSLGLTSCQKSAPSASSEGTGKPSTIDKSSAANITIASISPDPAQPLRAGDKVNLKVQANFSLPSQEGMVGLIIHGPDNKPIQSNLKPVSGPTGKHTTEIDFVVPNTTQVSVQVPLYVKGENKSVHVATKQYTVVAK